MRPRRWRCSAAGSRPTQRAPKDYFTGTVWQDLLEHWLLRSPPTPILGRLLFVAAFLAALWRAWPRPPRTHTRPLDTGLVGALLAFFIVCGAGLGLVIAKGIVEAHGGVVGAASDEGRGSTFYFTLPI